MLSQAADAGRVTEPFNAGWGFHKGPLAGVAALSDRAVAWTPVRLPHDWAIEGPFDQSLSGEQAKLPWKSEGWYRRQFEVDAEDVSIGRRTIFLFGGVMSNPTVYVNGEIAGSWRYGYNSFWVDATGLVKPGENTIALHATNGPHSSRWYPGAGIYRQVTRITLDPVHVPVWGVSVSTPTVTDDAATIAIEAEIVNTADAVQTVDAELIIVDPDGAEVARATISGMSIDAGASEILRPRITIGKPKLWDVDHPYLYTLRTVLGRDGEAIDEVITRFGVRTFEWTADNGFHLNGRRVQLKGVCLHHDNGPLGAVSLRDAEARKLRIMKEMGVNAVRTSHNPPSPELLDLCDEMGLVVIDELFDKWGPTASSDVSTAEFVDTLAEPEVRNFIRRDRNHACVVLWSIGNEIWDVLGNEDGHAAEHVAKMVGYFKKYDTTRPTTMVMHMTGSVQNGVLDALDTMGWNYGAKYTVARPAYPDVPQIYTESASAFSSRGYYAFPHPNGPHDFDRTLEESSYDRTAARWSDIPDVEFMRMDRDRYVAGEFVWTGFDYLGEPTPHNKEARSSYFGIVDLVGLLKDRYFLYRSLWNTAEETVHVLPHWTWPDRVGGVVPVYVYTSGDEAELFVNGKSLGRRKKAVGAPDRVDSTNIALGRPAAASSEEIKQDRTGNVIAENRADRAFDGLLDTRWCASGPQTPQWLSVDLGEQRDIAFVQIDWETADGGYGYRVDVSDDGNAWRPVGDSDDDERHGSRTTLAPRASGRFVRVVVDHLEQNKWASICEMKIEERVPENLAVDDPYYDVTNRYRLRWEDVVYEPGEIRAVAYRNGVKIGEDSVETAGPVARLRLTPEVATIRASDDSLAYVVIEAIDEQGRLCPHDGREVRFGVTGPAEIAGIGNGDPMCYDPFQDERHPLFNGRAVLILRGFSGRPGEITVTAEAAGVGPAEVSLRAE
ncbi:MAG: DUF4982 domain-containing protein [Phycisphaeraceae bacterium]|nr:MAG: DUF4982 domain-containing protein [Phycisphaeraceae bacterium]